MSTLGMDVAAMHRFADEFDRTAREINQLVFRVNDNVHRGVFEWFGDVAREYSNAWDLHSKAVLLGLESRLLELGRRLRAEIAAQENVSSASALSCEAPSWALGPGQSVTYGPKHELRITERNQYTGSGPRSISDLLDPLKYNDSNGDKSVYGYPGGLSVMVMGESPNRHAIVSISGTQDWGAGGTNIGDSATNLQHAFCGHTPKELAIAEALRRSGVTHADSVMLVGHSQGGADAIAFSDTNGRSGEFRVASIVTVGAPPTPDDPPDGVDVLSLHGTHDLVTQIAGYEPGGQGRDVHSVAVPERLATLPTTAHDPSTYQSHLPANSSEIRDFERRQHGFFSGGNSSTTMFSNERTQTNPALYRATHPQPMIALPVLPMARDLLR